MELSRRDPDTDDYAVLAEAPIARRDEGVTVFYDFVHGAFPANPGYVVVGVSEYELLLEAAELGELLAYLPPEAMPAAIDQWLARAGPDAIGVTVGRIMAHLARAKGTAEGRADQPE
jgi:hypothetical protein